MCFTLDISDCFHESTVTTVGTNFAIKGRISDCTVQPIFNKLKTRTILNLYPSFKCSVFILPKLKVYLHYVIESVTKTIL